MLHLRRNTWPMVKWLRQPTSHPPPSPAAGLIHAASHETIYSPHFSRPHPPPLLPLCCLTDSTPSATSSSPTSLDAEHETRCDAIWPRSNEQYGLMSSAYSLSQIVGGLVLGALSDRAMSRRSVLLISFLGSSVSYGTIGLSSSLNMLLVGRVVVGLVKQV